MANSVQCNECEAILEEFRRAFGAMSAPRIGQYLAEHAIFVRMIGGTEQDAERAEEALGQPQFRFDRFGSRSLPEGRYAKTQNAVRRMIVHRSCTGHRMPFAK